MENKFVLVVDDEPNIATLVRVNLELEGYAVVTASNGLEALERVSAETPALVILDLTMPKLGGWGVLRELRKNAWTAKTPVIVLSATKEQEDRKRGLEFGVEEFITKPFNIGVLMKVVHRILRQQSPAPEERKEVVVKTRVAIAGPGEACLRIMHTLLGNSNVEVAGLATKDKDSAAVQLARALHIFTTEDPYEVCRLKNLNIVIEAEKGALDAKEAYRIDPNLEILHGYTSFFVWNLLEEREAGQARTNVLVKELHAVAAENARLYEEVARGKSRIESLLSKLVRAQEEERKRIAAELHDSIAQVLISALTKVQVCQTLVPEFRQEAKKELEALRALLSDQIAETRRLILNLRPATLDDLGFVRSLQNYLSKFEREEAIQTSFQTSLTSERFPEAVETTIYRVLQEALANVKKHSEATQVTLQLSQGEEFIHLQVADDGKGMSLEEVEERSLRGECVGITGMKERVAILGGNFQIETSPWKGTSLFIRIPIRKIEQDIFRGS